MRLFTLLLLTIFILSGCASTTRHNISQAEAQSQTVPDPQGQWKGVDCNDVYYSLSGETPEDEQRRYKKFVQCEAAQLPPLDPAHREYFGEQYNPKKYLECKLHTESRYTSCNIYKLRRAENPEYWPFPDTPKPQWPDAPKENVYKKGMSSKQYFEALCKAEAGEFIYKTVENVEGVYQVRPRKQEGTYEFEDRYVIEDPYNYTSWEAEKESVDSLFVGDYGVFERPLTAYEAKQYPSSKAMQYTESYDANKKRYVNEPRLADAIKSRYGFTWRGINRPHDRDMAIAGGELAVVDLQTGEILGIRRGFTMSGNVRNSPTSINWEFSGGCPKYSNGMSKDVGFITWFINKVLKPAPDKKIKLIEVVK